jgi:hypothetical protein
MSKVKNYYLNLNGLIGKTNWLLEFRKNNNIDWCLVETWLSPPDSCPFGMLLLILETPQKKLEEEAPVVSSL